MTKASLRRELEYLPDGSFQRIKSRYRHLVGSVVRGSIHHSGYRVFNFGNRQVRYGRAVYTWHYGKPKGVVDHINGIRTDDRIENLRDVTTKQNAWNMKISKVNTSGVKGLRRLKRGIWRGVVKRAGKMHYVHSIDKEKAIQKLNQLRSKLHGQFARS